MRRERPSHTPRQPDLFTNERSEVGKSGESTGCADACFGTLSARSDFTAPQDTDASELKAVWADTDFDPSTNAVHYVRVLENPSCRWPTWGAVRAGTPPRPGISAIIQERA